MMDRKKEIQEYCRNRYDNHPVMKVNYWITDIPKGSNVLEINADKGERLDYIKPRYGVGLNINKEMADAAKKQFPEYEFYTYELDKISIKPKFSLDYVIISDMLNCTYDIENLLRSLKTIISGNTKIITEGFSSARINISKKDLINIFDICGFEITRFSRKAVTAQLNRRNEASRKLSCSVIIPCHNESENIVNCTRRVPDMGTNTEIIVVDDGSTDDTSQKVREEMKRDKRVKLISYTPNRGKGYAVKSGFDAAKNDILMILDADMTVMPEDLPRFFKPIDENIADFVNGTRFLYPQQEGAMRPLNYAGNKAFAWLISWIISQRLTDTLCGTKVILKKDYLKIDMGPDKWGDFDLIFGAYKLGLRIREVPVYYQERVAGETKMKVFKHGLVFAKVCWRGIKEIKLSKKRFQR